MSRRKVVISWSEEDAAFIAEAPELPGCMAHGESRESALANLEEAVELWLETARELGRPIPEPTIESRPQESISVKEFAREMEVLQQRIRELSRPIEIFGWKIRISAS